MSKGIILAGGSGSRLFPMTYGISKQLLPVYDKPMIYYPLSILMRLGIREILIIVNKNNYKNYIRLFKNSKKLGLNLSFKIQKKPEGIAQAFIIAENFIANENVCLILGDNIFYGNDLIKNLREGIINLKNNFSSIVGVQIKDPNDFGVINFDAKNKMIKITEKPKKYISNTVVSGLYFYDKDVVKYAKNLKPSKRGELEITDINNIYLKKNRLKLIKASKFFQDLENKTGFKDACIEEISYRLVYIDKKKLTEIAESMRNSDYGRYIKNFIKNENY